MSTSYDVAVIQLISEHLNAEGFSAVKAALDKAAAEKYGAQFNTSLISSLSSSKYSYQHLYIINRTTTNIKIVVRMYHICIVVVKAS